jgi:hypothetical protein
MFGTAGNRFWRGVREPWELLGRMRHVQPLWSRYWRTVLVQATLTLVAGGAVFWVGKQGAEAWNDAFGPDEIENAAPVAAGGVGSSTPATGTEAGRAGGTAGGAGLPPSTFSPPDPGKTEPPREPARHGPSRRTGTPPPPPGPPAGSKAPAPPAPPAAATTGPSASPEEAASDEKDSDDEEKDEESPAGDEEAADSDLEAKIAALQKAPAEERSKRTAELVAAAIQKAKKEAARGQHRTSGKDQGKDAAEELKEDREAVTEKIGDLTTAAEALAQESPGNVGKARRARRSLERELNEVEKDARKLEAKGAAPLDDAEKAKLLRARTALQVAHRHERGLVGRLGALLALLAAIYASLGIAQTGVLALSRDFHDALSRELSLLVHVAPEDPPMRPKIRLDLPWVRRKANRRAQFFLGFLPGTVLISIVGWLVPPHRTLTTVLTALWAAYWWMVMTAGQSARAWSPPETTPRPWYLRAWFGATEKVFLLRPFNWFGRIWERMAKRFYGPSERVEEQSLEFAGLALSRALTLIPVVKLLLRPLFPVSAARLLVEHATTARLPVPVTATEVADAALHAPDPEARAHSGLALEPSSVANRR